MTFKFSRNSGRLSMKAQGARVLIASCKNSKTNKNSIEFPAIIISPFCEAMQIATGINLQDLKRSAWH
jgi:hypothetical protein